MSAGRADRPLRTSSLRRRVALYSVAVVSVAMFLVMVLVDALFDLQTRRDVTARMRDRAQFAEQLARQRVRPAELARRLDGGGIRARLTTADGREFGGEAPEAESGPGRRLEPVRRRLADGSHLVLTADQDQVSAAQRRLRRVVGLVGLGAIVVTGVALVGTVRVSLRPLETMAEVARSIARGDRGRRLAPDEPDTELGRTAVAFDQMVDALEGAERQARESEARTRRFLADAAHELRTPIAGVQAAAEVLVQAGPEADPAERERMQVLLAREARRAGRLVTDLLALARIDAGLELRGERVDLLALAEHEAERVRLLSPGLTVTVVGEPTPVVADPDHLAQVLANLLDNARRHAPGDGEVTVRVSRRDGNAVVEVVDDGPGVPPESRERIFERLVRLDAARDRSVGGAGLGLSIARGLARAHGGELVCAEPVGGRGAVFRLTLPVESPAVSSAVLSASPAVRPPPTASPRASPPELLTPSG